VVRGRELPASATPDLAHTAQAARAVLGEEAYGAAFEAGRAVDSAATVDICREVFGAAPKIVPGWWRHPDRRRDGQE
jgi:IS5 family transposase